MTLARIIKSEKPLTKRDVKEFTAFASRKNKVAIVSNPKAWQRQAISNVLEAMDVPAADNFLQSYAITLVPPLLVAEPTIFLPFKPGGNHAIFNTAIAQLPVICHEFHHVRQWRDDELEFLLGYTKKAKRARIETEPREAEQEIYHWLTGRMLNPAAQAESLLAYGCRKVDVAVVTKHLRSHAEVVKRGGMSKMISKQFVAWYKRTH